MAHPDDDLSFNSGPSRPPAPPAPADPPWAIIAVAALLVALGALWYVATRGKANVPAPPPRPVAETTVDVARQRGAAEPGEAIDLPPLDQTDALVRTLVGRLSSHPVIAAWLTTEGLIRNMTVVVSNIADGETPVKFLKPLRPTGSFEVKTSGGLTSIDPASYQRYDGVAAAVDGLDARGVARFYATIKPRIDDAYHELVGPDANFDRTLERAIVLLLRTPIPDGDVQLRTGKMSYGFANSDLEELPKAQRQFLRMGPRNMRIVKAKLRAIAGYLGIPETALPPPDAAK
jgi:hypothetical protein